MGYPVDLDEYSIERLAGELERRGAANMKRLCQYCGRTLGAQGPCKMAELHSANPAPDASDALDAAGDGKGWDASRRMSEAATFIQEHALEEVFAAWLERRPR